MDKFTRNPPALAVGRFKLTPTERALIAQLTENTGRLGLDSGGAYGRNWERNQSKGFMNEPATVLRFTSYGDIEITHNVFHWLNDRVEYDADMTRKFKRFTVRKKYEDSGWPEIMEDFAAEHGADKDSIGHVNTYNGEDCLSQTLQYYHWCDEDGWQEYVALQIHGGCDVRGGYTAPKIYRVTDGLFDNARAIILCPLCRAMWDSDNGGYSWEPYEGNIAVPESPVGLTLFPDMPELLNLSENSSGWSGQKAEAYKLEKLDNVDFPNSVDREHSKFYVNVNGAGCCPYCLSAILEGRW